MYYTYHDIRQQFKAKRIYYALIYNIKGTHYNHLYS